MAARRSCAVPSQLPNALHLRLEGFQVAEAQGISPGVRVVALGLEQVDGVIEPVPLAATHHGASLFDLPPD